MNKKDLIIFLVLELFAIAWAGLAFAVIESRLVAGMAAGSYFVFVGVYLLFKIWRWPNRWKVLTIYPALVHTFVISLPMMIVRLSSWALAFEDVRIWGLPGPVFHKLSTVVFTVLIVATLVDLARALSKSKGAPIDAP